MLQCLRCIVCCFFFNDTATTEIYTLSLHDALPIWLLLQRVELYAGHQQPRQHVARSERTLAVALVPGIDRKSTRLNSSHQIISYAVFCLKKKITKASETKQYCLWCSSRSYYQLLVR